MTTPSDQGGCGSCWAFTTAATLEGGYAIKKNSTAERFSVQYMMDCDNVNQGCGGGWMLDAYAYTQKNGIVRESDYPATYEGRKSSCRSTKDKEHIKNDDQVEEDSITVERLKEIVAKRPAGLAMHSNPRCLMGYRGGVVREADCGCSFANKVEVNHAVTLVGYGKNT